MHKDEQGCRIENFIKSLEEQGGNNVEWSVPRVVRLQDKSTERKKGQKEGCRKRQSRNPGGSNPGLKEIIGKDHTDPQTLETTFSYRNNNNNQLIVVVLAKLYPTIGLYEICPKIIPK
ncbi:hypothetical protein CEXT_426051 [Caerostris extrusa]|uniref:Uncharacterized protein n=1 Tax=Caerostris extrusa TaxID=172846 RepID=A0AAV4P535_CAEEX|nr:hypothetical protein CEXT_426051 [Caerostris extrusa]